MESLNLVQEIEEWKLEEREMSVPLYLPQQNRARLHKSFAKERNLLKDKADSSGT